MANQRKQREEMVKGTRISSEPLDKQRRHRVDLATMQRSFCE
jgi:hypothetical protein